MMFAITWREFQPQGKQAEKPHLFAFKFQPGRKVSLVIRSDGVFSETKWRHEKVFCFKWAEVCYASSTKFQPTPELKFNM